MPERKRKERLCDDCGDPVSHDSVSGLCRSCSQGGFRPVPSGEWDLQAACRKGMWDVGLWMDPVARTEKHHCGRQACTSCYCAAKLVCAGCTVQEQCLEHATKVGEPAGIWGGLTTDERRSLMRRNRRRQAARKAV